MKRNNRVQTPREGFEPVWEDQYPSQGGSDFSSDMILRNILLDALCQM